MDPIKSPENMTRRVEAHPLLGLVHSRPGGIEAMERRGQEELVASDVLPSELRDGQADFEALGFTFGDVVDDDPLFRRATLPAGWRREGSGHAMWSYLVDERGIRRVAVFYKAAFYDRRAFMRLANVGRSLASDALHSNAPVTPAALGLERLTDAERAEFRAELDRLRSDIAEWPDIYGKYAERLAECDAALAAVAATRGA